jgi:hypothetical protein
MLYIYLLVLSKIHIFNHLEMLIMDLNCKVNMTASETVKGILYSMLNAIIMKHGAMGVRQEHKKL